MENLWEKIKSSVIESVNIAAEKTEEYTKIGKAKLDVITVKRKISKSFTELGGLIYTGSKESKLEKLVKSDEVTKLIEDIKVFEDDLLTKEKALDEIKKKPCSEKSPEPDENKPS